MSTEQNNNGISKKKFMAFLKNNIVSVVLAIALIIIFIWFSIKIKTNDNNFKDEKTQLISKYKTERDSLQIKHLEFASTVFSWSVRSELLRNNVENLNQLLTIFIRESGADLVQLVDPQNNKVLLSSDKKFEGQLYPKNLNYVITTSIVIKEDGLTRIITPVMGFNNKIGVLVAELETGK